MVDQREQSPIKSRSPILVVLLLMFIGSFAIDTRVAAFCRTAKLPREVGELLENAEPFGHGMGASLILVSVFVLDVSYRNKRFLYLLAGSLGAGLTANLIKLSIVRTRPRSLPEIPDSVWATFGGMFSSIQSDATQSFPSAHTATAVGLATMLSDRYPHGRWFFAAMAILVGLQRIYTQAHFPSDVCAGAIVGWLVALGCLYADRSRVASNQ